jgi:hypothetical protein
MFALLFTGKRKAPSSPVVTLTPPTDVSSTDDDNAFDDDVTTTDAQMMTEPIYSSLDDITAALKSETDNTSMTSHEVELENDVEQ